MAIFAKYDGIDGEATDADHDRWIEVLSTGWGAHNQEGETRRRRRRGAALVEDMILTIRYEKAAPKLLEACLTGRVIPMLEIELTSTPGGGAPVTYLKYELKNVMVASYQTSASGNDEAGAPTFIVSNDFEEIKVTYTEFDERGRSRGNVETEYSVGG